MLRSAALVHVREAGVAQEGWRQPENTMQHGVLALGAGKGGQVMQCGAIASFEGKEKCGKRRNRLQRDVRWNCFMSVHQHVCPRRCVLHETSKVGLQPKSRVAAF